MRGVSVPPTITDAIHALRTVCPSSARIYTLLPPNELYILSCFLALLIADGRSECPLGTLISMLTCDYAAGLVLYSLHVLRSICHFFAPLLVAHGLLPPLMTSPECVICHPSSVHLHFLCHPIGFPFVILDRYNAPSCAIYMPHGRGHA